MEKIDLKKILKNLFQSKKYYPYGHFFSTFLGLFFFQTS